MVDGEGARLEGRELERIPARRTPRWTALLPLALPLAVFLWAGLRGVDFGAHWDEPLHVQSVSQAVGSGTLLPASYNYPSVCFWTCVFGLGPEIVEHFDLTKRGTPAFLELLASAAKSEAYSLRMRGVFVVATSLALAWVYLFVLRWRGSWLEALAAAAILAGSWELGYHARWISPDPLLAMLAAATLAATGLALLPGASRRWLYAAAVAAGLGCGTKYQGGILIVPVLLAAWHRSCVLRIDSGFARTLARLGALFVAVYLVTTPGTLLQPPAFVQGVRYELRHYRIGHYGYTVDAGLDHLGRSLRYLGESLLSPYAAGAWLLAALALVGAAATWRESKPLALLLFGLPIFFVLYMCQFRAFFVRNILWTAPFFAVLAARGAAWSAGRLRSERARAFALAPLCALLAANALFVVAAGEGIRERGTDRFVRELASYVDARPDRLYYLSPRVAAALAAAGGTTRAQVTLDRGAPADAAAFYPDEVRPIHEWRSNQPGLLIHAFGPREVNFEYYATWEEPRILLLAREDALALGVLE